MLNDTNSEAKPIIVLFGIVSVLLAIAVVIGTYAVIHSPSPYELRSDADTAYAELRTRINVDEKTQAAVNTSVVNQFGDNSDRLDSIEDDLAHLMKVNKLPVRKRGGAKNGGHRGS